MRALWLAALVPPTLVGLALYGALLGRGLDLRGIVAVTGIVVAANAISTLLLVRLGTRPGLLPAAWMATAGLRLFAATVGTTAAVVATKLDARPALAALALTYLAALGAECRIALRLSRDGACR